MQVEDDGVLIDRARRGDTAAFEALVRRYDRPVLRLALRLAGSGEEARDVYQETFLKAFQSLPRFRGECAFKTWLLRIATNLCLDRLRRAEPRHGARGRGNGADRDGKVPDPADERSDFNPARALPRTEIRRRVETALAGLTPRERLVLEMRHMQGERLAAVARVLETTEETVRNCLYRAHRRLREVLVDLAPSGRPAGGKTGPGRMPRSEAMETE